MKHSLNFKKNSDTLNEALSLDTGSIENLENEILQALVAVLIGEEDSTVDGTVISVLDGYKTNWEATRSEDYFAIGFAAGNAVSRNSEIQQILTRNRKRSIFDALSS